MKEIKSKDKPDAKQLAQIRKSLAEIEELRYNELKNSTKTSVTKLEQASVDLRKTERELISKIGIDIASKIKADGESLEILAAKIRKRVEKMGRLPKRLDSLSKVVISIFSII